MSTEIKYVGGSKDGQTKRVRSVGEQKSIERYVWKEFNKATNQPTGRTRRENYRLERGRGEYVLQGDIESEAVQ